MRAPLLISLLLGSLVLGSCTSAVETSEVVAVAETPSPAPPSTTTTITAPPSPLQPDPATWYLVSVTAALPTGLSDDLSTVDGVSSVSTARVGTLDMVRSRNSEGALVDEAPDGFLIPLEAQSFSTAKHSVYVPVSVGRLLLGLRTGEVLLSRTSAALRQLGLGSEIDLVDGTVLVVSGIVADEWVGAAEVVVAEGDAEALAVTNERYSVVRFDGHPQDLIQDVSSLTETAVRIRSRDEVDMFRHADAVASQLSVKVRYGEFAYRPSGGGEIEIDPAWVDENIVNEHIPLLGTFRCHKVFVAMLGDVMTTLEATDQHDAINASAFRGCWNPRFIRDRRDLSHHAWGAAADINFGDPDTATDPRLLAAMTAAGIRSGHTWSNPDPGHFEWFPEPD